MTTKSILATFIAWLQARKEKIVVFGKFYQIVPDWYHGCWRDATGEEIVTLVGKDAMLIHLGLKQQA